MTEQIEEVEAPEPPEEVPEDVRALIGTRSKWWIAHEAVDRSYIRRFCDAIFNEQAIHRNEAAARAVGYPSVVGPPTSIVRYPHGGIAIKEPHEVFKEMVQVLVFGGRTHVHGGTKLQLFRPIREGDVISQRTRLRDVSMKQGRRFRMGMIVRETVYVNQFDEVIAHAQQIEFELP